MTKTIDIIGGGVSGLACAYYAHKNLPNHKIRLWEKDGTAGGLASTFNTGEYTIEKFYHHMFRRDEALQELISDCGLSHELQWKPAATGSYYLQKAYRLSSPLDLLKFKPLSFISRIRVGFLALHARTIKNWQDLDDLTAREYVEKIAGKEVWKIMWEPLFKGKFGKYADDVSAAWLWSKLVDRGSSRNSSGFEYLGYLKGGLGRIFQHIISELELAGHEINLGETVHSLLIDNSIINKIQTSKGDFNTDIVISCVQTPQLAAMISENTNLWKRLSKIEFLSNVCLVMELNQSLSSFYWTNITDTSAPFVGVIEQTKWTGIEEYNDHHIAYISSYVTPDDKRLNMSEKELFNYYYPFLLKMFPHFKHEHLEKLYLWKAPYAQPIVHRGYRNDVPDTTTEFQNLYICSMAQIYPNDRQVSNGIERAKRTIELIKTR